MSGTGAAGKGLGNYLISTGESIAIGAVEIAKKLGKGAVILFLAAPVGGYFIREGIETGRSLFNSATEAATPEGDIELCAAIDMAYTHPPHNLKVQEIGWAEAHNIDATDTALPKDSRTSALAGMRHDPEFLLANAPVWAPGYVEEQTDRHAGSFEDAGSGQLGLGIENGDFDITADPIDDLSDYVCKGPQPSNGGEPLLYLDADGRSLLNAVTTGFMEYQDL